MAQAEETPGDAPAGDAVAADAPVADAPAWDAPAGDASVADAPAADAQAAEAPAGDAPAADATTADAPAADAPAADAPAADASAGDAPASNAQGGTTPTFLLPTVRSGMLSGSTLRPKGLLGDGSTPAAWQSNRYWSQASKMPGKGTGMTLRLRPAAPKAQGWNGSTSYWGQANNGSTSNTNWGWGQDYNKDYKDYKDYKAQQTSQEVDPEMRDSLYVKGLPADATMESVKELFAHYGHVKSVKMLVQNAMLRGLKAESIALVVLETPEDAEWIRQKLDGNIPFSLESAVSVQYVQPKGMKKPLVKLRLTPAANKEQQTTGLTFAPTLAPSLVESNSRHVYLKGLPPDVDDNFLRRTFELFGTVEVARVLRNSAGHCAGVGFVRFSKSEVAAEAAKKMLGLPMSDGTPLYASLNPDAKFQAQRPQSAELQRQLLQMRQAELQAKDAGYQIPGFGRTAQHTQQQPQHLSADAYSQIIQQQALAAASPMDLAALAAQGQQQAVLAAQMGYQYQMPLMAGQGQGHSQQELAMIQMWQQQQEQMQAAFQQQYMQQLLAAHQQAQQQSQQQAQQDQSQQQGVEAAQPEQMQQAAEPQQPEQPQQAEAQPPVELQLQGMQQEQQQPQPQQPVAEQQQMGSQEAQAQAQQAYAMQAGFSLEALQSQAAAAAAAAAAAPAEATMGEASEGGMPAACGHEGQQAGGAWSAGAPAAAAPQAAEGGVKRPNEEGNAQEPAAKQARMPTRAMEWVERQEEFFPGLPKLPDGWVRAKARSSGKTYYLRLRDTFTTYNINEVHREAENKQQQATE